MGGLVGIIDFHGSWLMTGKSLESIAPLTCPLKLRVNVEGLVLDCLVGSLVGCWVVGLVGWYN